MKVNRILIMLLLLAAQFESICQTNLIEEIKSEANNILQDTQYDFPGFWKLSNKWNKRHTGISGNVKKAIISHGNFDVVVEFNLVGNLTYYKLNYKKEPNTEISYMYAGDGKRILKETSKHNRAYFYLDSNNYYVVNLDPPRETYNRNLDTIFIHESKNKYVLRRKFVEKDVPIDKYEFEYTDEGQFVGVKIHKNDILVGHTHTIYDSTNRVIEHQEFWDYERFAIDKELNEYLGNKIYQFEYDTIGFVKQIEKSIYSPLSRSWTSEIGKYESEFTKTSDGYQVNFMKDGKLPIKIQFDYRGNWINIEKGYDGKIEYEVRSIEYFE